MSQLNDGISVHKCLICKKETDHAGNPIWIPARLNRVCDYFLMLELLRDKYLELNQTLSNQ